MKATIILLSTLLITLLVSCSTVKDQDPPQDLLQDLQEDADVYDDDDAALEDESMGKPTIPWDRPIQIEYETIEDMLLDYSTGFQQDCMSEIQKSERVLAAGSFEASLTSIRDADAVKVPVFKGDPLSFRHKEGLPNILLDTDTMYGMTVTWYYPIIHDTDWIIIVGVIPDDLLDGVEEDGILHIHKQPLTAYTPTQATETVEKKVTRERIAVGDQTVTAIVTKFDVDPRYHIEFVYDTLYVKLYLYPDSYDRADYEDLSFASVALQSASK